jgi:hypothetical protein
MTTLMNPDTAIPTEERIASSLEKIADALEEIALALGPGPRGRDSVTILDQLCAIAEDTHSIVQDGL